MTSDYRVNMSYARYCSWCLGIGLQPEQVAAFTEWERVQAYIRNEQIREDNGMAKNGEEQQDWMTEIQQDYQNIVTLVDRIGTLARLALDDQKHNRNCSQRLFDMLEGLALLKKVLAIK